MSEYNKWTGFVNTQYLNFRVAASKSSKIITILVKNQPVTVIGEIDGFFNIDIPTFGVGYVMTEYLDKAYVNTPLTPPAGGSGTPGKDGKSAYELAVENGFEGSVTEWLESLKGSGSGTSGTDGKDGKSAYELAVDNGFKGSVTEWLESLKGKNGTSGAAGRDGADGVDGKDGKSAYAIAVEHGYTGTEDEWIQSMQAASVSISNNAGNAIEKEADGLFVKDTSEEVQAISDKVDNFMKTGGLDAVVLDGVKTELKSDIADHKAENIQDSVGIHGIRIVANTFQYHDKTSDSWKDVEYTDNGNDGIPVGNVTNFDIQSEDKKLTIYWSDPENNMVSDHLYAVWKGTKLVVNSDHIPVDPSDGTLLVDNQERNKYKENGFVYSGLTNMKHYYIALFPYSDMNIITNDVMNKRSAMPKDYTIYGIHINDTEADPEHKIIYLKGYDNEFYDSGRMNTTTDSMVYGSWRKAFFMPRSCMLKYNGVVDYYLDEDNNELRENGYPSDVANLDYEGNAMMEWPKIYWKLVPDEDKNGASFIWSNKPVDVNGQADPDMHPWSNIDANGDDIDHFYTPKFDGSYDGTRLRSISGQTPMYNTTAQQEVDRALLNDTTDTQEWYTGVYSDWLLITLLTIAVTKTTNSQAAIGTGRVGLSWNNAFRGLATGTMNKKGLFWGNQNQSDGVKVFGMENFWGNMWNRIAGYINNRGKALVKLVYGTQDGSTADGYNMTGEGYIEAGTLPSASNSYITAMTYGDRYMVPRTVGGSASTYTAEALWTNNGQINYASVGCSWNYGLSAPGVNLADAPSVVNLAIGASLSCKPLARKGESA